MKRFCIDCGKPVKRKSVRCVGCSTRHKWLQNRDSMMSGKTARGTNYCSDCGKSISHGAMRCKKCTMVYRWATNHDAFVNNQRWHDAMSKAATARSSTEESKQAMSVRFKAMWKNPAIRKIISDAARAHMIKQLTDSDSNLMYGIVNSLRKKASLFELRFKVLLDEAGINYVHQYKPKGYRKIYDFYLIDYNVIVELDSIHYHYSDWALSHGAAEADAAKDKWASDHGYIMIRIPDCDMPLDIVTNWLVPILLGGYDGNQDKN